jgi:hypothetical protein
LQHSDERPTTSGRPSLLSSEQQAEADRHRILGGLDSKSTSTSAGVQRARKSTTTWLLAGAAVLAIGAGSMVWLSSEGEKEIILAGTAPLPSTAAPAAALASEPVTAAAAALASEPVTAAASVEADEVSTAAILEDAPVVAAKSSPVAAKDQPVDELTKFLEPKAAPPVRVAAKPAPKKPVLVAKAAPAKAAPAKAALAKPTEKARPHPTAMASNVEPVIKKKPVVQPKAVVRQDSDVALLAALVAHSKASQPKMSTPAAKLQHCKTLGSVEEAEQCRARLCAASAKNEPECKAPKLAKAASES